jgi:hypothetical protein
LGQAVTKEDEVGPELDAEGTAERLAWSVLDFDVADLRVRGEQAGELGREGLAVRAPGCSEIDKHEALGAIDFFASGWGVRWFGVGHDRCSLELVAKEWCWISRSREMS